MKRKFKMEFLMNYLITTLQLRRIRKEKKRWRKMELVVLMDLIQVKMMTRKKEVSMLCRMIQVVVIVKVVAKQRVGKLMMTIQQYNLNKWTNQKLICTIKASLNNKWKKYRKLNKENSKKKCDKLGSKIEKMLMNWYYRFWTLIW